MDKNLVGNIVGNYTLLEHLGAGDTSTVYRARRNTPPHGLVALKFLPIPLAADDALRTRFQREEMIAQRLKHPHIVTVYDYGEHAGAPYIAMKLAEGGTLAQLIARDGALPLPLVLRILAPIVEALDYAHSQGVMHRDVKSGNILFDNAGVAYLGDFGVARLLEDSAHITGTGRFVGAAGYASPEQCRGEEMSPVSDIYGLGVVLFEMLTGKLPFEGANRIAVMQQHISEQPPDPCQLRPELPPGVQDVLRKALSKQPALRYQTASALLVALKHALHGVLGTGTAEETRISALPLEAADAPAPPSLMPDTLLRNLAPTRPTPPAARARMQKAGRFVPPEPASAPERWGSSIVSPLVMIRDGRGRVQLLGIVLVLLVIVAVLALVLG